MEAYEISTPSIVRESLAAVFNGERDAEYEGSFISAIVACDWERALRNADARNFDVFSSIMAYRLNKYPRKVASRTAGAPTKPSKPSAAGSLYECSQPDAHADYHARGFDCPCHPMIASANVPVTQ